MPIRGPARGAARTGSSALAAALAVALGAGLGGAAVARALAVALGCGSGCGATNAADAAGAGDAPVATFGAREVTNHATATPIGTSAIAASHPRRIGFDGGVAAAAALASAPDATEPSSARLSRVSALVEVAGVAAGDRRVEHRRREARVGLGLGAPLQRFAYARRQLDLLGAVLGVDRRSCAAILSSEGLASASSQVATCDGSAGVKACSSASASSAALA